MSLVVAYCIDGKISIVSDSAVSFSNESQRGHHRGVLKTIILNSEFCISFAGSVEYALNAIRQVKQQINTLSIEEILAYLLYLHLTSSNNPENRPDFIVAQLENSFGKLSAIKNGKIERNLSTCWIGSRDAFEAYQNFFLTIKDTEEQRDPDTPTYRIAQSAMSSAMNEIIDDAVDNTVGGFVVPVATTLNGFEYMTYMVSFVKQKEIILNEWVSLDLVGSSESGSYTLVLLAPKEKGVGAIGVYIYQPRLGYFFNPLGEDGNWIIKGGTHQQFVEYIKTNYGITLEGAMIG